MPNKRLAVSVVMCTHNGMEFIEEQLESILSQTYPPCELIVSDDNSTDGTLGFVTSYINTYIATHPELNTLKFRTISNIPALGVTKNFESAISAATGDLIALSDQDDLWSSDKLERMISSFNIDAELSLLHTDAALVDQNGSYLGLSLFSTLRITSKEFNKISNGEEFEVLLRRNIVTGATTMFRSSLIDFARPIPPGWLHDEWLGMVAAAVGKIQLLRLPLINYRQHGNNQVGAKKLGLRHALGRIIFPRTHRNELLLQRATELNQFFIVQNTVTSEKLKLIESKLWFEQFRSGLSANRFLRLYPVLKQFFSGNYSRFGLGIQDVIRDLLQPV